MRRVKWRYKIVALCLAELLIFGQNAQANPLTFGAAVISAAGTAWQFGRQYGPQILAAINGAGNVITEVVTQINTVCNGLNDLITACENLDFNNGEPTFDQVKETVMKINGLSRVFNNNHLGQALSFLLQGHGGNRGRNISPRFQTMIRASAPACVNNIPKVDECIRLNVLSYVQQSNQQFRDARTEYSAGLPFINYRGRLSEREFDQFLAELNRHFPSNRNRRQEEPGDSCDRNQFLNNRCGRRGSSS